MSGLYLASQSPRRTELLHQVGIEHTVVTSSYVEDNVVITNPDGSIVLGADTIVVFDGKVLGKPYSKDEARIMLRTLSGQVHSVITGVALLIKGREIVFHNETKVYFKTLQDFEIESYIDSMEPMDKAGAYGIQGKGALWVDKIEGSYTNVVGLPVEHVYEELCKALGVKS